MGLGFLEFFAGGGMARLGLGPGWSCLFANDFDPVKGAAYRANFPDAGAHVSGEDVWKLSAPDLPGPADLGLLALPGLQPGRWPGGAVGGAVLGLFRLLAAHGGPG